MTFSCRRRRRGLNSLLMTISDVNNIFPIEVGLKSKGHFVTLIEIVEDLITCVSGHKSRVLKTHALKIRKILNASLLTKENEQSETYSRPQCLRC